MEKTVIKTNPILLIDESVNFDEIKKFIRNNTEIITFDFSSHNILKNQKITHVLSDSFLSENDYSEIQEKSYDVQQWYNSEELKNFLLFENINLGQLSYVDTVYYVTKSLKKFIEILKIYEKFPTRYFIVTESLSKILECFTKSFQSTGKKIKSVRYHENIHYNFKVGCSNIAIHLSFKKYKKLKRLSENLLSLFFNPKNIPNYKKSTLLIEFDPVKYGDLLLKSKSSTVNFILYNRRRPAIWNKNSFEILKKSGTKIISENHLVDKEFLNHCDEKTKYYEQKISKMFDEQYSLKTFQFKEKNLWPILKNTLIQTILDNVKPKVFEILLAKKINQDKDSVIIICTIPIEAINHIMFDNHSINGLGTSGEAY